MCQFDPAKITSIEKRVQRVSLQKTLLDALILMLAGVSAWLITRAWQIPTVLDLSVAVVTIRTFAISRGLLHYCERLATHDTVPRATNTASRADLS